MVPEGRKVHGAVHHAHAVSGWPKKNRPPAEAGGRGLAFMPGEPRESLAIYIFNVISSR